MNGRKSKELRKKAKEFASERNIDNPRRIYRAMKKDHTDGSLRRPRPKRPRKLIR